MNMTFCKLGFDVGESCKDNVLEKIVMKEIAICGIIDVNMYNSILDPAVALDNSDELTDEDWERFDIEKYKKFICERAVIELKALLKRLPAELFCSYIEGSAHIDSPKYYNYRGDELRFQIRAKTTMSEKEMQEYLNQFFLSDLIAEFGAAYRIYEYVAENCCVEQFCC